MAVCIFEFFDIFFFGVCVCVCVFLLNVMLQFTLVHRYISLLG